VPRIPRTGGRARLAERLDQVTTDGVVGDIPGEDLEVEEFNPKGFTSSGVQS
jgi:hypothetical protein